MAYVVNHPADTQTIAAGPADIRAEIAKVANDQVADAGTLKGLSPGNTAGQIPISNSVKNIGLNAELHGGNLPSAYASAGHSHIIATSSSNGFMTNTDKVKLDTIAAGAQVNQAAFSNVLVGGITVQADSVTDTLELIAGANITLTPDSANDRITVAVSGTVPLAATAASCTGNSATATKFAAARTINGVSFDGAANITVTANPNAHAHVTSDITNFPTALPANGGNAATVGGLSPNGAPNNLLVLDASGDVPLAAIPNGVQKRGICFGMLQPAADQESMRYIILSDKYATEVRCSSKTAPTANTTIKIYKNGTEVASFIWTSGQATTTYDISPDVSLTVGDVIYAKISGAVNGLDIVTIQVTVVDR